MKNYKEVAPGFMEQVDPKQCAHGEVGLAWGVASPNRWFCCKCKLEFMPLPQFSKPLPYCGKDLCRDSIMEATLMERQQSSEQKPAEAHTAAEIAAEPNEIRVCGKHIVSFSGSEPCGICGGAESADIGKLDSADKDENVLCAFCPMRSPDRTMKACLDAGKCLYADKPVGHFALAQRQIPRNATELAAMAIRGEFNDAEKTGSAETGGEKAAPEICVYRNDKLGMECDLPIGHSSDHHIKGTGWPREPEKLNNAQNWGISGNINVLPKALAESSLSSPPQNSDSSAPTVPAPFPTQLDTTKEKL